MSMQGKMWEKVVFSPILLILNGMKIEITQEMLSALRSKMLRDRISTLDVGSATGLQPSTIARILRGETKTIQEQTFYRLSPYLGQKHQQSDLAAGELNEDPLPWPAPDRPPPNLGPALSAVSAATTSRQPVIGIAQAAGWVPALQPLGDFLSEFGDSVAWEEVEEGCWLLRVEGISMQPLLANGAILHVDTRRFPRRGEMVVARIASEEYPVVKYYDRRDGIVYLLRLNDEAEQRSYRINTKSNEDHILWMYPVTEFRSKPPTRLATSEDY